MNKVIMIGRLTVDPELRSASGRTGHQRAGISGIYQTGVMHYEQFCDV